MKEKPILFSGPMVRAILEGRKTITRRVMKPQPFYDPEAWKNYHPIGDKKNGAWVWQPKKDTYWFCWDGWDGFDPRIARDCPYGGQIKNFNGSRLWVRETWADNIPGCPNGLTYRADHSDPKGDGPANPIHWKPSIHMPRWASRLTLEITGVKVERVQDISEDDAIAEGIDLSTGGIHKALGPKWAIPRFQTLWDSINGKRPGCSWTANPWVWVIEFKVDTRAQ